MLFIYLCMCLFVCWRRSFICLFKYILLQDSFEFKGAYILWSSISPAPCFLSCLLGIWALTYRCFVTLVSIKFTQSDDEFSRCRWGSEWHWETSCLISHGPHDILLLSKVFPASPTFTEEARYWTLPLSPLASFSGTVNIHALPEHTAERFACCRPPYVIHHWSLGGPACPPSPPSLTCIPSINIHHRPTCIPSLLQGSSPHSSERYTPTCRSHQADVPNE